MNLKRKFLSAVLAAVCGLNVSMTSAGFLTASAVEKVPGYDNVDNYMADSIINGYVSLETGESTEAYGLYDPDSTSLYAYEKICADIVADAGLESSADFMELNPELLGDVPVQHVYEQFIKFNITSGTTYSNKTGKYVLSLLTELTDAGLASSEEAVQKLLESTKGSDNTKVLSALKKLGYEKQLSEYSGVIEKLDTDSAYDYFFYLAAGLAIQEINEDEVELLTAMKEAATGDTDFCNAVDNAITATNDTYKSAVFENDLDYVLVDVWIELESDNVALDVVFSKDDETAVKMRMLMQNTVNQYLDAAVENIYDEYRSKSNQDNAEDFQSAYNISLAFQQIASGYTTNYAEAILTEDEMSSIERDIKSCSTQTTIVNKWYENYLDYTDTETVEIDFTQDVVEYNGHYYKVFNNSISWIYAKEYCELMGGHLATVADEEEQLIVEGVAQACTDAENFWIGGYLSKDTDEWTWVDGTPFKYENWDANQPDFHQREEFYIRFTNDDIHYENWTAAMGKWNDCANEASGDDNEGDAVSIQTFAFICEWDSDDFQLDFIPGDANNDGEVNVRDAAYIAAALAKNEKEKLTLSADFNEDGQVNVRDAAGIAKYLATKKVNS